MDIPCGMKTKRLEWEEDSNNQFIGKIRSDILLSYYILKNAWWSTKEFPYYVGGDITSKSDYGYFEFTIEGQFATADEAKLAAQEHFDKFAMSMIQE